MPWILDGDLPSDAAMPGDIVIYNGTVTKAVAAESQPLQVQDDSADADIALLSMDAAAHHRHRAPTLRNTPWMPAPLAS